MLNLDELRLDLDYLESLKKNPPKKKKPRSTRGKNFLRGPIPLKWLSIAGQLPGKTLQVGLAIWLAYGFEKKERFKLTGKWLEWFDVGPYALRSSLRRLREAGLILLEYRDGQAPIVTLLALTEE